MASNLDNMVLKIRGALGVAQAITLGADELAIGYWDQLWLVNLQTPWKGGVRLQDLALEGLGSLLINCKERKIVRWLLHDDSALVRVMAGLQIKSMIWKGLNF
jgi:hypothetical protein